MQVSRRDFLAVCALVSSPLIPTDVFGWGAFKRFAGTHRMIAHHAHDLMRNNPGLMGTRFPGIEDIVKHDFATSRTSGTGPDIEGSTPYSWHYYNPWTKKGSGPFAVAKHFLEMVYEIRKNPNSPKAAKAASWAAHFIADMHVPYHVTGIPAAEAYKRLKERDWRLTEFESGWLGLYWTRPAYVDPGWGLNHKFEKAIVEFCRLHPEGRDKKADWFDPWYNNGVEISDLVQGVTSSHQLWEGLAHKRWNREGRDHAVYDVLADIEPYDPEWKNYKIWLRKPWIGGLEASVMGYAHRCANFTRNHSIEIWDKAHIGLAHAIRAVKTLYRGALSALEIKAHTSRSDKGIYKITGRVTNHANEVAHDVHLKIGYFGSDGRKKALVEYINELGPKQTEHLTWTKRVEPGQKFNFVLEVAGWYERQPDLGYNISRFTIKGGKDQPPIEVRESDCRIPPGAEPYETARFRGYKGEYDGKMWTVGPGRHWYDDQKRHIKDFQCRNYRGWRVGPQINYDKKGNIIKKWFVNRKKSKK